MKKREVSKKWKKQLFSQIKKEKKKEKNKK